MRRGRIAVVGTIAALVLGAACSAEEDRARTASAEPAADTGTASEPVSVTAGEDLMQWVPAPGSTDNTLTTNGTWFLTVSSSGTDYRLDGPERSFGSGADAIGDGPREITNAMLNPAWAVVVRQDQRGKRSDVAEVTNLSTGLQFPIDEGTDIPTTNGGTWALGADTLVHATVTDDGETCLASVDLAAQQSRLGWCAAPGQGFTAAHVTEAGTTLLTFDDQTPACRSVAVADGGDLAPFEGATACEGWDSSVLSGDTAVWSTVPQDDQDAPAEFHVREGDAYYDLGRGTSGTLVPCAGAAYFVRDPAKAGAPAQLVRWQDRRLSVVYEAAPGQSYLDAPRCGDGALVVTAHNESGDEQVMAALGG